MFRMMMSTQKLSAVFLVLSSVMIMVGFLSQFTSYKIFGAVISLIGHGLFVLERVVTVMVLRDRANRRRLMSKKEPIIVTVVVLIGSFLFCIGTASLTISVIMGAYTTSASFFWVGVAGCLVTLVAGVVKMVKELGTGRPEF